MQTPGIDANKLSFRRCVAAGTISSGRIFFLLFVPQLLNQSAVVRALLKGVIRLLWLPAVKGFWLIEHFQEAYTRLFSLCHNKQDIHSNWHSSSGHLVPKWRRINVDATWWRRIDVDTTSFWHQMPAGPRALCTRDLFAWKYILKVFNRSGEIILDWFLFQRNSRKKNKKKKKKKKQRNVNILESNWNGNEALLSAANSFSRNVNDTELVMTSRIWRKDFRVSSSFG